jgi:hypothetical protein
MGCRRRGWRLERVCWPTVQRVGNCGDDRRATVGELDEALTVHWQSQAFGAADWENAVAGHDESMQAGALLTDLGRI